MRPFFCTSRRLFDLYSACFKHSKPKKMVFECQRDSYKNEFTTKVVSCKECGSNEYEVVLEDTILFPEGGGQVSFLSLNLFSLHCVILSWIMTVMKEITLLSMNRRFGPSNFSGNSTIDHIPIIYTFNKK